MSPPPALRLQPLALAGAYRLCSEPAQDERGHFARLWCRQTLAAAGLSLQVEQASASFNRHAGTLRGLHFAWPPARETKLVRCTRGRLLDVLLDLRPDSAQFGRHLALELSAQGSDTLVVPPGVAHGFQTLVDDTELHYMMSEAYQPNLLGGVRWDDPQFGIAWPLPVRSISPRDADYADFDATAHALRWRAARGTGADHAA